MSITKTIQAIGKDIGTINKAISSIDGKIKQVSDELSSQYVTQSSFETLTAQINALAQRVEKLEQGTSAEPTSQPSGSSTVEPSKANPTQPRAEPSVPTTAEPPPNDAKLYRNRLKSDKDDAQVIKGITTWYDTLPKDNGQITIDDTIRYSKEGKFYIYFDGFRVVKNNNGNGVLHRFDEASLLSYSNNDGERGFDIQEYYEYDRFSDENVQITIVRQIDDNGIYAVYNAMSDKKRSEIFSQDFW